jgi:hypothetical protein
VKGGARDQGVKIHVTREEAEKKQRRGGGVEEGKYPASDEQRTN